MPHLIWYVITIIQIKQNILYEEWHTNKYTPVQKRKEESHQGEGGSNMYITTIRTIMRETKKKIRNKISMYRSTPGARMKARQMLKWVYHKSPSCQFHVSYRDRSLFIYNIVGQNAQRKKHQWHKNERMKKLINDYWTYAVSCQWRFLLLSTQYVMELYIIQVHTRLRSCDYLGVAIELGHLLPPCHATRHPTFSVGHPRPRLHFEDHLLVLLAFRRWRGFRSCWCFNSALAAALFAFAVLLVVIFRDFSAEVRCACFLTPNEIPQK